MEEITCYCPPNLCHHRRGYRGLVNFGCFSHDPHSAWLPSWDSHLWTSNAASTSFSACSASSLRDMKLFWQDSQIAVTGHLTLTTLKARFDMPTVSHRPIEVCQFCENQTAPLPTSK
jgi:hypothetical protein